MAGFAAPVVSSSHPVNTALSGAGIISISGLSFAYSANFTPTSSLLLSNACSTTAWTSLTAVSCAPQSYKGSALCLGVTLSAVVGTRTVMSGIGSWDLSDRSRFSFDGSGNAFSIGRGCIGEVASSWCSPSYELRCAWERASCEGWTVASNWSYTNVERSQLRLDFVRPNRLR